MKTVGIPPNKHNSSANNEDSTCIQEGKPISGGNLKRVSPDLWSKAHFYVLQNTPEVVPYIDSSRHMVYLKEQHPTQRQKWLEKEHCKTFGKWLRDEVEGELAVCRESIPETLRWISHGPHIEIMQYEAYYINGYLFRTKSREGRVYQNSGVTVEATDMHISGEAVRYERSCYYGVLQEIWALDYNIKKVPLFKCDWVDNKNGIKKDNFGYKLVEVSRLGYKDDPFILASQARQVFYVKNQLDKKKSIVLMTPPRNYRDSYDDVDEEFSTTVLPRNDNILPHVDPIDFGKESRDDYFCPDCRGILVRKAN